MKEHLTKITNNFHSLIIPAKCSIIDLDTVVNTPVIQRKSIKKTNKLKKKPKQAKTKVHNGKKVKYFNCLFKFEKVAERALLYITITVYMFGLQ